MVSRSCGSPLSCCLLLTRHCVPRFGKDYGMRSPKKPQDSPPINRKHSKFRSQAGVRNRLGPSHSLFGTAGGHVGGAHMQPARAMGHGPCAVNQESQRCGTKMCIPESPKKGREGWILEKGLCPQPPSAPYAQRNNSSQPQRCSFRTYPLI